MSREQAWEIVCEFTKSESLRGHALAVEIAMRGYARLWGEDEDLWGVVGLIHDFDYEIHPTLEQHPQSGAATLRERGMPEEIVRAALSHAEHTGVGRESRLEKTLFAVDELCGFLVACALVRPGRSLVGLEVSSVRKKLKQKAFAAAVNREEIVRGAEELGVRLEEHIGNVTRFLAAEESRLGLGGARDHGV
jgi:putative nucleotidyltransferase with HDIG domain